MNLFTMAEAANNYSAAGAGKTKLPTAKMLLLGILASRISTTASTKDRFAAIIRRVFVICPGNH